MKYFKSREFDSPDAPGSGIKMKKSTLAMLDKAREIANVPFVINSGYRTIAYNNTLKHSVSNSAHTKGMAADIRYEKKNFNTIINALIAAGFTRIGIAYTFIHADNDLSKPNPAVWTYSTTPKGIKAIKGDILHYIKTASPEKKNLVRWV